MLRGGVYLLQALVSYEGGIVTFHMLFFVYPGLPRLDVDISISSLDSKHSSHHSTHQRCMCVFGSHV